jgi:hypothetical protein
VILPQSAPKRWADMAPTLDMNEVQKETDLFRMAIRGHAVIEQAID